MCGRYHLLTEGAGLAELFGVPALATHQPRYNAAPSQMLPSIAEDKAGVRHAGRLRWGFVPRWAADPKKAPINARSETAGGSPFFADCLRLRRCLVPADGFYEWLRRGRHKQPFCFRLWDDEPFAFAGLWDVWQGPGGPLPTFCILTTAANELVRPAHDRMPVIVSRRHYDLWLSRDVEDAGELACVLRPFASDAIRAFPVGPAVNDARKDGPECLASPA